MSRVSLRLLAPALAAIALGIGGRAEAGFLPDRASLDAFLGGSAINEGFETYNIGFGNAQTLGVDTLDSTTAVLGQGPGLVVGGIQIDVTTVQWNGDGFHNLGTKSVSGAGNTLTIDFTGPNQAFGVDMATYAGFPNSIDATVYAIDDTTIIGTLAGIPVLDATGVFLGFSDAGGVGRVDLASTLQGFSIVIDNLEFGNPGTTAVPEPSTLLGCGLAFVALAGYRLRRRVKAA